MRAFILSIVTMITLVVIWGVYVSYTHDHILKLTDSIEDHILVSIAEEDWESAQSAFDELSDKWHQQKKVYSFFVDTNTLNQADFAIAKAQAYLKARDYALAAGELANIKEQLHFMHTNELITLDNLF